MTIEASPAGACAGDVVQPSFDQALVATLVLKPTAHDRRGERYHGELTRVCVVSLEHRDVDETLDVRFASAFDDGRRADTRRAGTLSMAEEEPDPIVDAKIDLGKLARNSSPPASILSAGPVEAPEQPEASHAVFGARVR